MTFSTNTAKYLEYGSLIGGLSLIFTLVIIQFGHLEPSILILSIPLALCLIWMSIRHPLFIPYLIVALSPLYFDTSEGFTIQDLIYFSLSVTFLLFYFTLWAVKLDLHLGTALDKLSLLIVLLTGYSIVIGYLNNASLFDIFADAVHFIPFAFYFGFRKLLSHDSWQKALYYTFIVIIIYVAVRNLINYREILIDAIMPWQQERARVAVNEVILLTGSVFFFIKAITSQKITHQIIFLGFFMLAFVDLILTQSRGYWLAFLISIIALFIISDRQLKKRLIAYMGTIILIGSFVLIMFFYDQLQIALEGLANRFESLGTGELDVSLKERLLESIAVWEEIIVNPIAGYGMGTTYRRVMLFLEFVEQRYFIHNGYILVWYKMGIVGFFAFLSYAVIVLTQSFRIYKRHSSPEIRTIALTIFSVLAGMLLVNNTSPQFYHFDSLIVLTLMAAFVSRYHSNSPLNN